MSGRWLEVTTTVDIELKRVSRRSMAIPRDVIDLDERFHRL
jgi:hypothetical protein